MKKLGSAVVKGKKNVQRRAKKSTRVCRLNYCPVKRSRQLKVKVGNRDTVMSVLQLRIPFRLSRKLLDLSLDGTVKTRSENICDSF